jgi:predicted nucleic acid-binding protein
VYEVFRRVAGQRDERTALDRVSYLLHGRVVDLTAELAILSARVGIEHRLPLADSIVYATALAHDAVVWTMDGDFDGLDGVRYLAPR